MVLILCMMAMTAEELGMSVQIVTLPEGADPGGLVKDQVNRISKRLYG